MKQPVPGTDISTSPTNLEIHPDGTYGVTRNRFDLVEEETHLQDRYEVMKHLPDILGRALARSWIDDEFRDRFVSDPKGTIAAYDVHLPNTIEIDIMTEGLSRPQVVVLEKSGLLGKRNRLLSLQIVMMAGK